MGKITTIEDVGDRLVKNRHLFMKARTLSRDQIWTHVTNKVMGASAHCEMWAALNNIVGHNLSALQELDRIGMLADCGPLLNLSKRAHQITMTLEVCSLYERPENEECVTLRAYRDKVADTFVIPLEVDQKISSAYQTARRLYKIRSSYWAHGLALTSRRNLFHEAGLTDNQVIRLISETKEIVVQLGEVEGRRNFDLNTDRDVSERLALTNNVLLKAIGTASVNGQC